MDKPVKVILRQEDIAVIDRQAHMRGVPRLFVLREIIERYLSGPESPKPASPEDVKSIAVLEERIKGLEVLILELKATKAHHEGLIQQLMSEQNRLITDGRGGIWARMFGNSKQ